MRCSGQRANREQDAHNQGVQGAWHEQHEHGPRTRRQFTERGLAAKVQASFLVTPAAVRSQSLRRDVHGQDALH